MSVLTDKQCEELHGIIKSYVRGDRYTKLAVELQEISYETNTNCRDLFQLLPTTYDNGTYPEVVNILLKKAHLSEEKKSVIIQHASNVYELLRILADDGNRDLNYFLKMIHDTKPPHNWALIAFIGSVLTAGLGIFFHQNNGYLDAIIDWLETEYPFVIRWLTKTFSLLRNSALLGIGMKSATLIYNWYYICRQPTKSWRSKLGALFFLTLNATLAITGYAFIYFACGIMQFPAAILLTLSAAIPLIESIYTYYSDTQHLKKLKKPQPSDDWYVHEAYIRKENISQLSLSLFSIRLVSALVSTCAIALWCFLPPSLIISISSMVFIWTVNASKNFFIASKTSANARKTQQDIKNIESEIPEALLALNQITRNKLSARTEKLDAREKLIGDREQQLTDEAQALKTKHQLVNFLQKNFDARLQGYNDARQDLRKTAIKDLGLFRIKRTQSCPNLSQTLGLGTN